MSQDVTTAKRSEQIRHDIDSTRQQMDQTIDALATRLKGRHLADEIIGIFRSNVSAESANKIKDKVTQTTNSAVNTVVNSVKANPWPLLLIGAGAAWLVYSSRRSSQNGNDEYLESPYENDLLDEPGYELSGGGYGAGGLAEDYESSDLSVDESGRIEDSSTLNTKFENVKGTVREKAGQAKEQLQQKASEIGDKVRQSTQAMRDRASEIGSRVQERSRQVIDRSKERIVQTANDYPVELGLGVLALGIVAGLAIPTPEKVNQVVGPRIDQVRDRAREAARDLAKRGKNVVQAAAQAAKQEADSQGISPDALREKASAVAQRTKQAATDSAREQGVLPTENFGQQQPQATTQA